MTDRLPLITAVIPSYNSARFVPEAIESVLNQTYPQVEVIVVDNDSQDETPQVMQQYQPQVRYIRQENRGLSGSRNRGIEEGRGELFAFLDADDRWRTDKLEKQYAALAGHPEVGLVHTDVYYWEADEDRFERRDRQREKYAGPCYETLFWGNAVLPSTVLIRRECLDRVGGFDRKIERNSTQDYDLWLRIARHYEFGYVPEPLVDYRQHEENASRRALILREDELYTIEKALAADEQLESRIGSQRVAQRLFELYYDVGYLHFDQGDFTAAHRYFRRARSIRGTSIHNTALWLATLLPPRLVRLLRGCKQRLAGTRDASPMAGSAS